MTLKKIEGSMRKKIEGSTQRRRFNKDAEEDQHRRRRRFGKDADEGSAKTKVNIDDG
jgi:hypothetical protein